MSINKKELTERDICTKFITPALIEAKWDLMNQIREEVLFAKGRVIVRGQLSVRGEAKKADCVLYHKPGIALAVVEARTTIIRWAQACSRGSTTPRPSMCRLYSVRTEMRFGSPDPLKVLPFPKMGTAVELTQAFGGRAQFQAAVRELKQQLYNVA